MIVFLIFLCFAANKTQLQPFYEFILFSKPSQHTFYLTNKPINKYLPFQCLQGKHAVFHKKCVSTKDRSFYPLVSGYQSFIREHLWKLNGYHTDLIQRGKLLSRKDSNLFEQNRLKSRIPIEQRNLTIYPCDRKILILTLKISRSNQGHSE